MKKRLVSLLVVMTMLCVFVSVVTKAYDGTKYGDYLYYAENVDNDSFTITDCGESAISVEIPPIINGKDVTGIGYLAFWNCKLLTNICIPASVTKIVNGAFEGCISLTDVYYSGTETQWKLINIGDYNDDLLNATIHYKNGAFGNTNSTSDSAPIITSAKVEGADGAYNLFNDKLTVTKDSDIAASSYAVSGTVDANGCTDVHLYITQGAKKSIEIPLDGSKSIQLGKEFSAGQPIYMTAIDKKTGKSTSKRTKLSVVGNGMLEGSLSDGMINLIDDFFVDVPEDVPVIGKEKIGLSLGSIKSNVEIDGNKFKVALGTDFLEGKKGSDGKWRKEAWTGFKKGFKDAADSQVKNMERYIHMAKSLEKLGGKKTSMAIKNGTSGSANVTGYIEGYIDDSGIHPTEGGVIVNAELKYTYQGMTVVVVVPVYYEIGAGGEVTAVLGVKDLVPGNGLQGAFTGSITPAVFFEIGGGVGVPLVLTAGVSGKVKAELEFALNKIYQKLDVTGSAAFKLTGPFGIPTYSKDFAKGTWHIYETGNKNTLLGKQFNLYSLYSVDNYDNNPYALIDIDAPITITEHGDNTQEWVGDEAQIKLMAVDYTNQDVKVLEKDSYENIAPVFAEMDGKNVIAWITDNKTRADGDKTMLVYSVEENGTWSAPKAVYDDGFADSTPAMKDGYIVWQKATKNITADMTARDLGEVCEIYFAK